MQKGGGGGNMASILMYIRPIQTLLLGGDYFPELMPCSEQVCFCFNQLSSELKMTTICANSA